MRSTLHILYLWYNFSVSSPLLFVHVSICHLCFFFSLRFSVQLFVDRAVWKSKWEIVSKFLSFHFNSFRFGCWTKSRCLICFFIAIWNVAIGYSLFFMPHITPNGWISCHCNAAILYHYYLQRFLNIINSRENQEMKWTPFIHLYQLVKVSNSLGMCSYWNWIRTRRDRMEEWKERNIFISSGLC